MKRTGEILKTSRESKGLSLHEVGMSLKINSKTLQAIEEGDTTRLPARTFLRGFVKSYAQFLKLNLNEVLAVFQEELGEFRPQTPSAMTEASSDNEPSSPQDSNVANIELSPSRSQAHIKSNTEISQEGLPLKKIGAVFLVASLLVLIVVVARLVNKYQKERVIPSAPKADLSQKDLTKEAAKESSVKSEVTAETSLEGKHEPESDAKQEAKTPVKPTVKPIAPAPLPLSRTTVPAVTPIPQKLQIRPPAPAPVIKVIPPKALLPKITTPPPSVPPPSVPPPSAQQPPPQMKPVEVIVEALGSVHINYDLGDGKIKAVDLKQDQIQTFKSTTKVNLDVSDGGAINVIVNGRERGVPGAAGKSTKLSYSK